MGQGWVTDVCIQHAMDTDMGRNKDMGSDTDTGSATGLPLCGLHRILRVTLLDWTGWFGLDRMVDWHHVFGIVLCFCFISTTIAAMAFRLDTLRGWQDRIT